MGVRLDLVQELLARGALPADRGADARAAAADDVVDLEAWLRAAGCDANELLLAACEVFALPAAPKAWLESPLTTDALGAPWDAALFRALGAIPVHAGPPLRIAFGSPFVATSERALALPTHRAYLAAPDAIAAAQERVLARASTAPAPASAPGPAPDPAPAPAPAPGATAPPGSTASASPGSTATQPPGSTATQPPGSTATPPRGSTLEGSKADWAAAASEALERPQATSVPPSTEAAATTKVPRLAQNMAGILDAIARDATDGPTQRGDAARSDAARSDATQSDASRSDASRSDAAGSDEQQTGRHMMAMPSPLVPVSTAPRDSQTPEVTVMRMVTPLGDEPIRPRMKGAPMALTPEIEAQLAEAAGLGGMTFGVRAIVKRATTAEELANRAALEAKGVTALDLLRAVGAFPAALAAKLMADVASALARLHEQGFVHREMRPSTVLISSTGAVSLAEQGRARSSNVDELVTDVFSLGRLFHHLLSGRDPFADGDAPPPDLMEVAPTLPELLPIVVDKLMKRERAERVQSAREAHALLSPLVQIIDGRHPRLLADVVDDPAGVVKRLRVEQAFAEYLRASACMKQRPPRKREAAYALRRSIELDSMELRGQKLLRKLCASEKYTFVIPDDPALVDAKNGDDIAKLRDAGARCLESGAIEQAALCFRRACDERVKEIVGDDPRQPFPYLPEVPADNQQPATAVTGAVDAAAPQTTPAVKLRVVADDNDDVREAGRKRVRAPVVAALACAVVIAAIAFAVSRLL